MIFFEKFQKHILSVLIRNVAHHNGSPTISLWSWKIDYVCLGLLSTDRAPVSHRRWLHHIVVVILGWHCHHHRHRHRHLHARGGWSSVGSVSSRNWVRTMFSLFFSDNSHTTIYDSCNFLIILFTMRRLFPTFLLLTFIIWLNIFFSFILEKKKRVIESVLTVGDDFSPVFSRNFQSCKGIRTFCERRLSNWTRVSFHFFFFFQWSWVRSFESRWVGGDEAG